MSIILCKPSHPGKAMKFSTLFITVYCTKFSQPFGQVLITPLTTSVYLTVVGTVHGFQKKLFSLMWSCDRLEAVLSVFSIVPGCHIKVLMSDMWRHHHLVSRL